MVMPRPFLLCALLVGQETLAFPGKRLFGRLRDDLQEKRARGRKRRAEGQAAQQEAGSLAATSSKSEAAGSEGVVLAADYPPGALPLLREATEAYVAAFGERPTMAAHAPGRVNLIGEHTDYTGGFVLPLALDKRTVVVGTGTIVPVGSSGEKCQVLSVGVGGGAVVTFDSDLAVLAPGAKGEWANYVKGVVKQYGAGDLPMGHKFVFKAAYASDVPLGAGLSSSAALEVSTATLLEAIMEKAAGIAAPPPELKALRCQAAEHEFCGMPCGIMDQFISALAVKDHLLQIDCRANVGTPVALPEALPEVVVLVTNSNVKHELTGSEYPTRVKQCAEATALIAKSMDAAAEGDGQAKQTSSSEMTLRDADVHMLESARKKEGMDDATYRRARHVIRENGRVLKTVAALAAGDLESVGRHMLASHQSLKRDFEVSCPELDTLVELASAFGDGVYGSRMTGGGFGGCTVTLVKAQEADALMAHLKEGYLKATGKVADSFVTRPGQGAGLLKPL